MKLFDKIRILRKARGLSQEQLGYSLSRVNKDGISRQTVSDWENGKFEPKLENIRDLAEVFDVSFDALLDESIDLDDEKVLYDVINKNPIEHKIEEKKEVVEEKPIPSNNKVRRPFDFKEVSLLILNVLVIFVFSGAFMSALFNLIEYYRFNAGFVVYLIAFASMLALSGVALGLFFYSRKKGQVPVATMVILIILLGLYTVYSTVNSVVTMVNVISSFDPNVSTTYYMYDHLSSFGQMLASMIVRLVYNLAIQGGLIVCIALLLKAYTKQRAN